MLKKLIATAAIAALCSSVFAATNTVKTVSSLKSAPTNGFALYDTKTTVVINNDTSYNYPLTVDVDMNIPVAMGIGTPDTITLYCNSSSADFKKVKASSRNSCTIAPGGSATIRIVPEDFKNGSIGKYFSN